MDRDETKAGRSWAVLDKKLSDMQHGNVVSKHSEFRIKLLREKLDERYVRKLEMASNNEWCLQCDYKKINGKCIIEDAEELKSRG